MELSFACENSAEASYLAQELELALHRRGLPAAAMVLKPSSAENMDIGSVLTFIMENSTQILGATETIASLATCIYEVATKYNCDPIVETPDGKVRIPVAKIDMTRIEAALARKPKPKPKQRSKA